MDLTARRATRLASGQLRSSPITAIVEDDNETAKQAEQIQHLEASIEALREDGRDDVAALAERRDLERVKPNKIGSGGSRRLSNWRFGYRKGKQPFRSSRVWLSAWDGKWQRRDVAVSGWRPFVSTRRQSPSIQGTRREVRQKRHDTGKRWSYYGKSNARRRMAQKSMKAKGLRLSTQHQPSRRHPNQFDPTASTDQNRHDFNGFG